jgi:hypothetical protein
MDMSNIRTLRVMTILCAGSPLASTIHAQMPPFATWQMTAPWNFSGNPSPKWENGVLLAYEYAVPPATLVAFDKTGRLVAKATITVPGASRLWLVQPAAAENGVLAITGAAMDADGAFAPFIAWMSPAGALQRIVRTAPFQPTRVCFDGDGMLWSAGMEFSPDGKREAVHDVC